MLSSPISAGKRRTPTSGRWASSRPCFGSAQRRTRTSVPPTTMASAWDEQLASRATGGSDNPNDRNGYSPADHAPTVNPFYIALPFNDLAFPDKARRRLPAGLASAATRTASKPVSACKDRWVEIKTEDGTGHICYAQWEDVGPLRYDHAEYVFGDERPDTYTRAGLVVCWRSRSIWHRRRKTRDYVAGALWTMKMCRRARGSSTADEQAVHLRGPAPVPRMRVP